MTKKHAYRAAGILGGVIGIVLLYRFIRPIVERHVLPTALYWIEYARFYIESIPQVVFWVLIVVIALIIALFSFRSEKPPGERSKQRQEQRPGRVASLTQAMDNAIRHDYSRSRFAQYLAHLTLNVHRVQSGTSHRGLSFEKIQTVAEENHIPIPDFIVENVQQEETRDFGRPRSIGKKDKRKQLARIEKAIDEIEVQLKEKSVV